MFTDTQDMIYTIRRKKGIPQRRVARYLHIGDKTYRAYEQGLRPIPPGILQSIAFFIGVDVREIVSEANHAA